MSCVWNSLCAKVPALKKFSPKTVRDELKKVNTRTTSITWNGDPLSKKEQQENFDWIAGDTHSWNNGHDTSSCDPYFALVCELFVVNIDLKFAQGYKFGNAECFFRHPKATSTIVFVTSKTHCT
jgi:hypothetical protein